MSYDETVAPHAGAWIETCHVMSSSDGARVAPHAGAWIETALRRVESFCLGVAPHAGAWIETARQRADKRAATPSRPTRARGLKLVEQGADPGYPGRAPRGRVD